MIDESLRSVLRTHLLEDSYDFDAVNAALADKATVVGKKGAHGKTYSILPRNFALHGTLTGWVIMMYQPYSVTKLSMLGAKHFLSDGRLSVEWDWYVNQGFSSKLRGKKLSADFLSKLMDTARGSFKELKGSIEGHLEILEEKTGITIPADVKRKAIADGVKKAKRRLSAKGTAKKTEYTWDTSNK